MGWDRRGVGMVNTVQKAADIVQTVRDDALKKIRYLAQKE